LNRPATRSARRQAKFAAPWQRGRGRRAAYSVTIHRPGTTSQGKARPWRLESPPANHDRSPEHDDLPPASGRDHRGMYSLFEAAEGTMAAPPSNRLHTWSGVCGSVTSQTLCPEATETRRLPARGTGLSPSLQTEASRFPLLRQVGRPGLDSWR
jgi:hypothetical protein